MEGINAYILIISASGVLILSYIFNSVSKKTNIPSVLMLILLGILITIALDILGISTPDLFPILEILGIVGLIMIVLEAALDLELKKEKSGLIWRSFFVAILALGACVGLLGFLFKGFLNTDWFTALLYATPLSIMSSAIVIPSVISLPENKKEFLIYESAFSDIFGIMFFYFLLESVEVENMNHLGFSIAGNILMTIVLSVAASYGLILLFQQLRSQAKLFLLIAVLLLLYSFGKMAHLSSLIIILVFGIILQNNKIFFRGWLSRFRKENELTEILKNFKLITLESAFVVRTFFFVVFGMTIILTDLVDIEVGLVSLVILIIIYASRWLLLKAIVWRDICPQLYVAPRGLITILLFFSIPQEFKVEEFESGILLVVIIATSIIMGISLVRFKKSTERMQEEDQLNAEQMEINPEESPGADVIK